MGTLVETGENPLPHLYHTNPLPHNNSQGKCASKWGICHLCEANARPFMLNCGIGILHIGFFWVEIV